MGDFEWGGNNVLQPFHLVMTEIYRIFKNPFMKIELKKLVEIVEPRVITSNCHGGGYNDIMVRVYINTMKTTFLFKF